MNPLKKISFVIPVYNEQEAVRNLHKEIVAAAEELSYDYEIIFVNDGSTDNTLNELKKLKPIKIINFRKNFGQTAAFDAGFKEASGEVIVSMDGDGQDDPANTSRLLKKLQEDNLDAVSGWRKNRKDKFSKRLVSRSAALLSKVLLNDGIHDSGCMMKIYKRECFDHIDLTGEIDRFIPALLKIKGFKVGEIEVNHRPRLSGKSKFNWTRGLKGGLDMFSVFFWRKYANRPMHLFGVIAVMLIFISIISALVAFYLKIFLSHDLSDTLLPIFAMFGFLIGIQFFVFGLLADILSKNYFSVTKDKIYDIQNIIENKSK